MHKISNFTGQARHGWEKMTPSIGFGRPHQQNDLPGPPPIKRSMPASSSLSPNTPLSGHSVNLSFNVPFSSHLPGLDREEVIYASPGAFARWTFPEATPEGTPIHELPVHKRDVENLRTLCKSMSDASGGSILATVTSSKPKPVPGMQRGPLTALVTNVCIFGEADVVHKMRSRVLNETPITLVWTRT